MTLPGVLTGIATSAKNMAGSVTSAVVNATTAVSNLNSAVSSVSSMAKLPGGFNASEVVPGQGFDFMSGGANAVNSNFNIGGYMSKLFGFSGSSAASVARVGAAARPAQAAVAGDPNDWRVRLSVPSNIYSSSPILKPLLDAGGAIFPYTPQLTIQHSAVYDPTSVTHQNYAFHSYSGSKVESIQIVAPFYVEDALQANYWIAMAHFLRSVTKMYTGDDTYEQGSPPPILTFNAYGNHVYKNVPVVVTGFTIELPNTVDYIATTPTLADQTDTLQKSASTIQGLTASSGASGVSWNSVAGIASTIAVAAGKTNIAAGIGAAVAIGQTVSGIINRNLPTGGASGSSAFTTSGGNSTGGTTHVPTSSTFTVNIQPVYSKDAVRTFSLKKFVNGDYIDSGYV